MFSIASEYRKLQKTLKKTNPGNLEKLNNFLSTMRLNLENPGKSPFELQFKLPDKSSFSLFFKYESPENNLEKKLNYRDLISEKLIEDKSIRIQDGAFSIPENNLIYPELYRKILNHNKKYLNDIFGNEFICFSENQFSLLKKIIRYSLTNYSILFNGESGTFRTGLAKSMHYFRKAGPLTEISCKNENSSSLGDEIEIFLKKDANTRPGILIKNIEQLSDLFILEPLIREPLKNKYVYFTSANSMFEKKDDIPDVIFHGLSNLAINTIPLRERSEDLFFSIMNIILDYNKNNNNRIKSVSQKFLNGAMNAWWPENFHELQAVINKTLEEEKSETLNKFIVDETSTDMPSVNLTPLEEGEKNVIIEYLQKNKFNKNKTRKDLGISINTLNTKMEKYGIKA